MTQTSGSINKHNQKHICQRWVFLTLLVFSLSCITPIVCASPPAPPALTQTITGLDVSLTWTTVPDATEYILSYAPYPYTGPETIGNIDMNAETRFSITLWDGAAYLVAVQALNAEGVSEYSNIETIVISTPEGSLTGIWLVVGRSGPNSCGEPSGGERIFNISIEQTGDSVTLSLPSGARTTSLSGNSITWSDRYSEDGGITDQTQTFLFADDGSTLTGTESWTWSDGSESCSGASTFSGSKVN